MITPRVTETRRGSAHGGLLVTEDARRGMVGRAEGNRRFPVSSRVTGGARPIALDPRVEFDTNQRRRTVYAREVFTLQAR